MVSQSVTSVAPHTGDPQPEAFSPLDWAESRHLPVETVDLTSPYWLEPPDSSPWNWTTASHASRIMAESLPVGYGHKDGLLELSRDLSNWVEDWEKAREVNPPAWDQGHLEKLIKKTSGATDSLGRQSKLLLDLFAALVIVVEEWAKANSGKKVASAGSLREQLKRHGVNFWNLDSKAVALQRHGFHAVMAGIALETARQLDETNRTLARGGRIPPRERVDAVTETYNNAVLYSTLVTIDSPVVTSLRQEAAAANRSHDQGQRVIESVTTQRADQQKRLALLISDLAGLNPELLGNTEKAPDTGKTRDTVVRQLTEAQRLLNRGFDLLEAHQWIEGCAFSYEASLSLLNATRFLMAHEESRVYGGEVIRMAAFVLNCCLNLLGPFEGAQSEEHKQLWGRVALLAGKFMGHGFSISGDPRNPRFYLHHPTLPIGAERPDVLRADSHLVQYQKVLQKRDYIGAFGHLTTAASLFYRMAQQYKSESDWELAHYFAHFAERYFEEAYLMGHQLPFAKARYEDLGLAWQLRGDVNFNNQEYPTRPVFADLDGSSTLWEQAVRGRSDTAKLLDQIHANDPELHGGKAASPDEAPKSDWALTPEMYQHLLAATKLATEAVVEYRKFGYERSIALLLSASDLVMTVCRQLVEKGVYVDAIRLNEGAAAYLEQARSILERNADRPWWPALEPLQGLLHTAEEEVRTMKTELEERLARTGGAISSPSISIRLPGFEIAGATADGRLVLRSADPEDPAKPSTIDTILEVLKAENMLSLRLPVNISEVSGFLNRLIVPLSNKTALVFPEILVLIEEFCQRLRSFAIEHGHTDERGWDQGFDQIRHMGQSDHILGAGLSDQEMDLTPLLRAALETLPRFKEPSGVIVQPTPTEDDLEVKRQQRQEYHWRLVSARTLPFHPVLLGMRLEKQMNQGRAVGLFMETAFHYITFATLFVSQDTFRQQSDADEDPAKRAITYGLLRWATNLLQRAKENVPHSADSQIIKNLLTERIDLAQQSVRVTEDILIEVDREWTKKHPDSAQWREILAQEEPVGFILRKKREGDGVFYEAGLGLLCLVYEELVGYCRREEKMEMRNDALLIFLGLINDLLVLVSRNPSQEKALLTFQYWTGKRNQIIHQLQELAEVGGGQEYPEWLNKKGNGVLSEWEEDGRLFLMTSAHELIRELQSADLIHAAYGRKATPEKLGERFREIADLLIGKGAIGKSERLLFVRQMQIVTCFMHPDDLEWSQEMGIVSKKGIMGPLEIDLAESVILALQTVYDKREEGLGVEGTPVPGGPGGLTETSDGAMATSTISVGTDGGNERNPGGRLGGNESASLDTGSLGSGQRGIVLVAAEREKTARQEIENGNREKGAALLVEVALLYDYEKNHRKASECLLRAATTLQEMSDGTEPNASPKRIEAADAFMAAGSILLKMGDFSQAHYALNQAATLYEAEGLTGIEALSRENLGRIFFAMGQHTDAALTLDRVGELYGEPGSTFFNRLFAWKAYLFEGYNWSLERNFDNAGRTLAKAFRAAQKVDRQDRDGAVLKILRLALADLRLQPSSDEMPLSQLAKFLNIPERELLPFESALLGANTMEHSWLELEQPLMERTITLGFKPVSARLLQFVDIGNRAHFVRDITGMTGERKRSSVEVVEDAGGIGFHAFRDRYHARIRFQPAEGMKLVLASTGFDERGWRYYVENELIPRINTALPLLSGNRLGTGPLLAVTVDCEETRLVFRRPSPQELFTFENMKEIERPDPEPSKGRGGGTPAGGQNDAGGHGIAVTATSVVIENASIPSAKPRALSVTRVQDIQPPGEGTGVADRCLLKALGMAQKVGLVSTMRVLVRLREILLERPDMLTPFLDKKALWRGLEQNGHGYLKQMSDQGFLRLSSEEIVALRAAVIAAKGGHRDELDKVVSKILSGNQHKVSAGIGLGGSLGISGGVFLPAGGAAASTSLFVR